MSMKVTEVCGANRCLEGGWLGTTFLVPGTVHSEVLVTLLWKHACISLSVFIPDCSHPHTEVIFFSYKQYWIYTKESFLWCLDLQRCHYFNILLALPILVYSRSFHFFVFYITAPVLLDNGNDTKVSRILLLFWSYTKLMLSREKLPNT